MSSTQFILFMLFMILSVALCKSEPPVTAPSTGEALALADHAWTSGILGVILITLGTFLTFTGKRFFKLFLGVSGFLTFGVLGLNLVTWVHEVIFTIPHAFYVFWTIAILCGALGAWLCFTMWEIGVLAAAGFGGYSLGVWVMSMKTGLLIEGYMTRSVFLTVCSCAAIAFAWFFDEVAIVVASAISGSMCLVVGVDCFLKWGLAQVLLAMMLQREFGMLAKVDTFVRIELAAVAVLAIMGALVQFLTGSSKKGHRSDRV